MPKGVLRGSALGQLGYFVRYTTLPIDCCSSASTSWSVVQGYFVPSWIRVHLLTFSSTSPLTLQIQPSNNIHANTSAVNIRWDERQLLRTCAIANDYKSNDSGILMHY